MEREKENNQDYIEGKLSNRYGSLERVIPFNSSKTNKQKTLNIMNVRYCAPISRIQNARKMGGKVKTTITYGHQSSGNIKIILIQKAKNSYFRSLNN